MRGQALGDAAAIVSSSAPVSHSSPTRNPLVLQLDYGSIVILICLQVPLWGE